MGEPNEFKVFQDGGAFIAKLRGDLGQASLLTKQAFDLEQEAAALIAHQLDAEPTRSVLHLLRRHPGNRLWRIKSRRVFNYNSFMWKPP
ncbi:hypothetical protein DSM106972_046940 [Dulcicalothrix desertica PCC 7102]|uniref:Uncharacterized protein n=2 Tax=Dulcicalothrix desertica TaxID=32056 RepID=A0A433VCD9_9CYAN|nr:hypothetical protein DSM106972_046940 [Dulcicalothrix desertica PCC 7102]TWH43813.1 hypothetical protein CAL7102_07557 [Dulcicalothrix desertica PCC 7102]